MDQPRQNFDDIREQLKTLLSDGDVEKLSAAVRDVSDTDGWQLISLLSDYVTLEQAKTNNELFECCESLLYDISQQCFPEEVLLEFIEQAEDCDSTKFVIMLKGMQNCLLRLPENNICNSLEWCSNTILRHIYDMPVPDDLKLEGDETLLLESTDVVQTIGDVYANILEFFKLSIVRIGDNKDLWNTIMKCLLKLLGKPLAYIDLGIGKSNNNYRLYAERIIGYILESKVDLLEFLNFVDVGSGTDESAQAFVDAEYVNTALGVFYYLIFHEGILLDHISYVYNPIFIVSQTLALSRVLLCFSHSAIQKKGLLLAQSTIERLAEKSVHYNSIDRQALSKFVECLAGIMIYSEVKENRQVAIGVFKSVLFKLDDRGRYVIMANIQEVITQPGFIGYLATLLKDMIAESLVEASPVEYLRGKYLNDLLNKFCRLENGVETDLIELSDQIVSSLNLLRYLALRDKDNITGFWDYVDTFTTDFLEQLKKGIMISRAHYQLQKNDVETNVEGNGKVEVKIGQVNLPVMPKEEKVRILDLALNTFDLMEGLLSRLNECIALHKTA